MALPPWVERGDVLDRQPAAEYLHKLILQRFHERHSKPGSGAVCVALEAEWGAGKTFFLERWADDLADMGHVVAQFNAWENDLSEDPLLGFMAGLRESLAPQFAKLPIATAELEGVVKKAARAVVPAGKVIAKAILKKATGIIADEVADSISGAAEAAGEAAIEAAPEALEAYFEHALKAHTDRQRAIRELKRSIEELVAFLAREAGFQPPLFVLVDELDRCRPDYAIRLLEGIKHLFNASGVCFVLSTNLRQLSASAQAVYGSAFDGYTYLQRFFSMEYHLPDPNYEQFARALLTESRLPVRLCCWSAIPLDDGAPPEEVVARNFALVAETFRLSLRAQGQVLSRAEAAAVGLEDGASLHPFYLFCLSALFQRGASVLTRFIEGIGAHNFLLELGGKVVQVGYEYRDSEGRPDRGAISNAMLMERYYQLSQLNMNDLQKEVGDPAATLYPKTIPYMVFCEGGKPPFRWNPKQKPSISRYVELIRRAGMALQSTGSH